MNSTFRNAVRFVPEEFESVLQSESLHHPKMKMVRFQPKVGDTVFLKHHSLGMVSGVILVTHENEFSVELNLDSGPVVIELPFTKIAALDLNSQHY